MQLDDNDDFNDDDDVNFSHEWFPLFIHILDKKGFVLFHSTDFKDQPSPTPPSPLPRTPLQE